MQGREINEATLNEAGKIAAKETQVRDSIRGRAWYRREMVEVLLRRVGLKVLVRIKNINN
jgi:carbon-monoxide dehydrogenase medium subunit